MADLTERPVIGVTVGDPAGIGPEVVIKALDFHGTVSLTMGLKFLRTSVDHGTAFDIAGQGKAAERGMVEAIRVAGQYAVPVRERLEMSL